jgi:hypothetical protein
MATMRTRGARDEGLAGRTRHLLGAAHGTFHTGLVGSTIAVSPSTSPRVNARLTTGSPIHAGSRR